MEDIAKKLRSIEEIPQAYVTVFANYPKFNVVQSEVLDEVLHTDNSVVVSAPTGSGKTAIFEMAIVRLLDKNQTPTLKDIRMVYVCPMKALCSERTIDWSNKFGNHGLKIICITGDSDNYNIQYIFSYNLIICTPEKWDILTRRWREFGNQMKTIKLFMIDEVQLLNADGRGPTLEVIVCRMKTIENQLLPNEQKIRFLALSASIANVDDIADWLGATGNRKYFKFSEDTRPIQLNKIVIGYSNNHKNFFTFDIALTYRLPNLIKQHAQGKPTLIFCSTRKSVEMTSSHLVENLSINLSEEQKVALQQIANSLTDKKLQKSVIHGIAIHHAGLLRENRLIIEKGFRDFKIPVLVTTSTLAMGVNLPAHLVIIKSTKTFEKDHGFKDYDEIAIFQMIGRAGRIQFDTSGTAIILTSFADKEKYERMVNCSQLIESNLHKHLTEHLNAEIVLRTITDLDGAMRWVCSTFLYFRAQKYPVKYGFQAGLKGDQIDKKLLEMCQIEVGKLVKGGMCVMNENTDITATVIGETMAKFYIAFDTMKLFTEISGFESLNQILTVMSKCKEFAEVRLRVNDKKFLNALNHNKTTQESVRYKLIGKIGTVDMKVNCLIQAVLGNKDISDHSLLNDATNIMRNCERVAGCLVEYLQTRTDCYNALLSATIMAKCVRARLWENSPFVAKQLKGIGQVFSGVLAKAGKDTFMKLARSNPRQIELILNKKPPFGSQIVEEAERLPFYDLQMDIRDGKQAHIRISLLNGADLEQKSTINLESRMTLLVGNSQNKILLYEQYTHAYMIENPLVSRTVDIDSYKVEYIHADFISDDWVGFDCKAEYDFPKQPGESRKTVQTVLDMYAKGKTANSARNKSACSVSKSSKKSNLSTKLKTNIIKETPNKVTIPDNSKVIVDKPNEFTLDHHIEILEPTSLKGDTDKVINNRCSNYNKSSKVIYTETSSKNDRKIVSNTTINDQSLGTIELEGEYDKENEEFEFIHIENLNNKLTAAKNNASNQNVNLNSLTNNYDLEIIESNDQANKENEMIGNYSYNECRAKNNNNEKTPHNKSKADKNYTSNQNITLTTINNNNDFEIIESKDEFGKENGIKGNYMNNVKIHYNQSKVKNNNVKTNRRLKAEKNNTINQNLNLNSITNNNDLKIIETEDHSNKENEMKANYRNDVEILYNKCKEKNNNNGKTAYNKSKVEKNNTTNQNSLPNTINNDNDFKILESEDESDKENGIKENYINLETHINQYKANNNNFANQKIKSNSTKINENLKIIELEYESDKEISQLEEHNIEKRNEIDFGNTPYKKIKDTSPVIGSNSKRRGHIQNITNERLYEKLFNKYAPKNVTPEKESTKKKFNPAETEKVAEKEENITTSDTEKHQNLCETFFKKSFPSDIVNDYDLTDDNKTHAEKQTGQVTKTFSQKDDDLSNNSSESLLYELPKDRTPQIQTKSATSGLKPNKSKYPNTPKVNRTSRNSQMVKKQLFLQDVTKHLKEESFCQTPLPDHSLHSNQMNTDFHFKENNLQPDKNSLKCENNWSQNNEKDNSKLDNTRRCQHYNLSSKISDGDKNDLTSLEQSKDKNETKKNELKRALIRLVSDSPTEDLDMFRGLVDDDMISLLQGSISNNNDGQKHDKISKASENEEMVSEKPDSTTRLTTYAIKEKNSPLTNFSKPKAPSLFGDVLSQSKTLRWRSPLIVSPANKFSPKFDFIPPPPTLDPFVNRLNISIDSTSDTAEDNINASSVNNDLAPFSRQYRAPEISQPRKKTRFPLSDKDCEDGENSQFKIHRDLSINSSYNSHINLKSTNPILNSSQIFPKSQNSNSNIKPVYEVLTGGDLCARLKYQKATKPNDKVDNINLSQIYESSNLLSSRKFSNFNQTNQFSNLDQHIDIENRLSDNDSPSDLHQNFSQQMENLNFMQEQPKDSQNIFDPDLNPMMPIPKYPRTAYMYHPYAMGYDPRFTANYSFPNFPQANPNLQHNLRLNPFDNTIFPQHDPRMSGATDMENLSYPQYENKNTVNYMNNYSKANEMNNLRPQDDNFSYTIRPNPTYLNVPHTLTAQSQVDRCASDIMPKRTNDKSFLSAQPQSIVQMSQDNNNQYAINKKQYADEFYNSQCGQNRFFEPRIMNNQFQDYQNKNFREHSFQSNPYELQQNDMSVPQSPTLDFYHSQPQAIDSSKRKSIYDKIFRNAEEKYSKSDNEENGSYQFSDKNPFRPPQMRRGDVRKMFSRSNTRLRNINKHLGRHDSFDRKLDRDLLISKSKINAPNQTKSNRLPMMPPIPKRNPPYNDTTQRQIQSLSRNTNNKTQMQFNPRQEMTVDYYPEIFQTSGNDKQFVMNKFLYS